MPVDLAAFRSIPYRFCQFPSRLWKNSIRSERSTDHIDRRSGESKPNVPRNPDTAVGQQETINHQNDALRSAHSPGFYHRQFTCSYLPGLLVSAASLASVIARRYNPPGGVG